MTGVRYPGTAMRLAFVALLALVLTGCETAYYDAMEQIGFHKRDILIDRIVDAQEAQEEGQEQFRSALEQFQSVVNFDGGELQTVYEALNDEYEASVSAAERINDRIDSVESVADALFDEWRTELDQYTNQNLKRDSERQLQSTERRYKRLLTSMRSAERTIDPVLNSLRDNVLYLKHNLNARAIASLRNELQSVNTDVEQLLTAMQAAITESESFVNELRNQDPG